MGPFVSLGRDLSGSHTCGFSPSDTPGDTCGAPAVWHVLWTGTDAGMACSPHMEIAQLSTVYVGRHHLVPDCGMPGAIWGEDGCAVPPIDAYTQVISAVVDRAADEAGVPQSLLHN